jgi:hypothetical protein
MQQDALNKGFTRMEADELGLYRYKPVFFLFVIEQDGTGRFSLWRSGRLRRCFILTTEDTEVFSQRAQRLLLRKNF